MEIVPENHHIRADVARKIRGSSALSYKLNECRHLNIGTQGVEKS